MAQLQFFVFLFIALMTGTYAKLRSASDNSAFPVGIASVSPQKDPNFIPWTNPEGADCTNMATFALWETSFYSAKSWDLVFSNWQFGSLPVDHTNSWNLILTFDKRNNYDVNATITIAVRSQDNTAVNILTQSFLWNATAFTNVDSEQMIIPLSDYSDILTPSNIENVVVRLRTQLAKPDDQTIEVNPISMKIWCLTAEYQYYDCPNSCSDNGICFASPVFGCVCSNASHPSNSSAGPLLLQKEISPIDCSVIDVQTTEPEPKSESNATRDALLGSLLGGALFLALLAALILHVRNRRRGSSTKYSFQTQKPNKMELGNEPPQHRYAQMTSSSSSDSQGPSLPSSSPLALVDYPRIQHLEVKQQLGGGNFGSVYLGEWNGSLVAVKKLNNEDAFREFAREASILAKLSHPNVVQFLGIYTDPASGQPFLVTEHLPRGSLLDVLSLHKSSLKPIDLINMCINATSGMCYLESMNIVHRDLAVRNLLVTTDYTVKVGDFGLSRVTNSYQANDTSKIPVKWTAPEVLEGNPHTSRSDVWSLGVVIWEIFSFGTPPYVWVSNKEAVQLIPKGEILPRPTNCPDSLYLLLLQCWSRNPEERPTFLEILNRLKTIKKEIQAQTSQHKSYNIFVTDEDSPVLGRERTESENSYTKTPGARIKSKASLDAEELERHRAQLQQQQLRQEVQDLRDSILVDNEEYEIVNINDDDNDDRSNDETTNPKHPSSSSSSPNITGTPTKTPKRATEYHTENYEERISKQAPPSFSDYEEFHLGRAAAGDEVEQSESEASQKETSEIQSRSTLQHENDYEETLRPASIPPEETDQQAGEHPNEESEVDVNDSSSSYIYRLKKVKRLDLDSSSYNSASEAELS